MKDDDCVRFMQWLLPQLQMRWPGFRKVRRQVCKRIRRRIIELGLPDLTAYQLWIDDHREELGILDGFCRITISRFYRDRAVFDFLRDAILPDLAANARQRGENELLCWSAGCASGEEPYTINMIWKQAVLPHFPEVALRIVATDIDPQMLARARRGSYPPGSLKDLPDAWIAKCFSSGGGELAVRAAYRSGVEWYCQDIRREMPDGAFDMILCRHLAFTYFDTALQVKTLGRIVSRLRPSGFLVFGKQEPLPTTAVDLTETSPRTGVYQMRVG